MTPFSILFGRRGVPALALTLSLGGVTACQGSEAPGKVAGAQAPLPNPCSSPVSPRQQPSLPVDPGDSQIEVDCSAWQTFIALNWRADPAKPGQPDLASKWDSFGRPNDTSATVWESYQEAADLFGGDVSLRGQWKVKRPAVKKLSRTSKFGSLDLTGITEAGGNQWLTNQRGDLTYYEITLNPTQVEFITVNNLTTVAGQQACATQPGKTPRPSLASSEQGAPAPKGPVRGGFNLPSGGPNGWIDYDCVGDPINTKAHPFNDNLGVMEIKAAWTPLPDPSLHYRYKTAVAEILDPVTRQMRRVTVGLVGLHIVRKRFPKLPWVWATFEHIDNTPDENPDVRGGWSPPQLPDNPNQVKRAGYTFFNPGCVAANDKAFGCVHNSPPTPCLTGSIRSSQCQPYNAPMQITRMNRVDPIANSVTAYAWSLMPKNSVFNYYRLINVQWPQARIVSPPPGPGLKAPLNTGSPQPSGRIVANTTMETFVQTELSCLDCHANATIASADAVQAKGSLRRVAGNAKAQSTYASDYSFIFYNETTKKGAAEGRSRRR
jgi:hypothetical protein